MSYFTRFIGTEGAAFERVSMVFEALGYQKPRSFDGQSGGNYVANIVEQYRADFDADEVQNIIRFGISRSRETIRNVFAGLSEDEALYTVFPHKEPFVL